MKYILSFLFISSLLFANIATVVDNVGSSQLLRDGKSIPVAKKQKLKEHDTIKTGKNAKVKIFFKDNTAVSLGKNTSFEIDSYLFTGKKDSHIKFKVLKGFFKTVTGQISKVAPSRFKLQTKNATIGIRGTVFAANVGDSVDVVICTDGTIVLFTPNGDVEVSSGKMGRTKKGVKPKVEEYSQKEKEELIKQAGWHGSMSLKELITYIKANFKEPLRSQLLATLQNILNKDSDERKKYRGKPKTKNVDDKSFVDSITINDREFDELPNEVEFYPEDLKDGKVIVQGILESEDKALSVNSLHVEITTDGGENWSRAKGHSEWEWSFTPELEKNYEFSLRVVMEEKPDNAPIVIAGAGLVKQEFQKVDKKIPILVKQKEFTPKVITTEPIVLKFKKFTPKVITTEPIVLKFKKFIAKVITTEPIVLKFKKFVPKIITTEPIVLKFKKFTPKVVTTEPIVLKFKKFVPKVITTEPIVLKFKKQQQFQQVNKQIGSIGVASGVVAIAKTDKNSKANADYETTTPTIKFKLKQPTVYETTTPTIKFKLKQPTVYETTTPTIKFKLR